MTAARENAAERAGRAARTRMGRRRRRTRVVALSSGGLLALLSFVGAVWLRLESSESLKRGDDLLADKIRLERSLVDLAGRKARLTEWDRVEPIARRMGLRPPERGEVVWVAVPEWKGRKG